MIETSDRGMMVANFMKAVKNEDVVSIHCTSISRDHSQRLHFMFMFMLNYKLLQYVYHCHHAFLDAC